MGLCKVFPVFQRYFISNDLFYRFTFHSNRPTFLFLFRKTDRQKQFLPVWLKILALLKKSCGMCISNQFLTHWGCQYMPFSALLWEGKALHSFSLEYWTHCGRTEAGMSTSAGPVTRSRTRPGVLSDLISVTGDLVNGLCMDIHLMLMQVTQAGKWLQALLPVMGTQVPVPWTSKVRWGKAGCGFYKTWAKLMQW